MKEKYGTDFTLVEKGELTSSTLEIYVESPEYKGEKILVMEERLNKGEKLIFHDNFLCVKYHEQTKKMAEKMAEEVYGECKVLCEVNNFNVQPDEFDNTTTFEEFCSKRESRIWVEILLPADHSLSDKENELKQLEQLCLENRFACICDVYYADDADAYRKISTHEELMDYGIWYSVAGKFLVDNDFTNFVETWR